MTSRHDCIPAQARTQRSSTCSSRCGSRVRTPDGPPPMRRNAFSSNVLIGSPPVHSPETPPTGPPCGTRTRSIVLRSPGERASRERGSAPNPTMALWLSPSNRIRARTEHQAVQCDGVFGRDNCRTQAGEVGRGRPDGQESEGVAIFGTDSTWRVWLGPEPPGSGTLGVIGSPVVLSHGVV